MVTDTLLYESRIINLRMKSIFDLNQLFDLIHESFPKLGFESCYIFFLTTPEIFPLISGLCWDLMGKAESGFQKLMKIFLTFSGIIDRFLKKNESLSFSVQPLCSPEKKFGFILLPYLKAKGSIYEDIKSQVSSSITGAFLVKTRDEANNKLKEMARQKNLFFQNITHELRTPLALIIGPLESIPIGKV